MVYIFLTILGIIIGIFLPLEKYVVQFLGVVFGPLFVLIMYHWISGPGLTAFMPNFDWYIKSELYLLALGLALPLLFVYGLRSSIHQKA